MVMGVLDHRPFATVAIMVMAAVAVSTASMGMPAFAMMIPLSGTMYMTVKKVVAPASTSVRIVVPLSVR